MALADPRTGPIVSLHRATLHLPPLPGTDEAEEEGTMKPSKKVLALALKGRTFIPVGRMGHAWRAYKRPAHLLFKGQTVIDFEAPDGSEWTAMWDAGTGVGRPMVYRLPP